MATTPLRFKEYTILPLILPPTLKFATEEAVQHYIYLRAHEPNIPTPESPRSLFIANVPIDATSTHFRALFADQLGGSRVEHVDFDSVPAASKKNHGPTLPDGGSAGKRSIKKRKRGASDGDLRASLPETWDRQLHSSGSTAVVVFVDRPSRELALAAVKKAVKSGKVIFWGGNSVDTKLPALGLMRYKTHQSLRYPPASTLQSLVENYMIAYSSREDALGRTRARQRAIPDADGFVTVTRGGRTGPARAEEAKEKMEKMKEKEEKKRRDMETSGFYRFQVREAKKREAKDLIGRFEGDRRRVEQMSKSRKRIRPE